MSDNLLINLIKKNKLLEYRIQNITVSCDYLAKYLGTNNKTVFFLRILINFSKLT